MCKRVVLLFLLLATSFSSGRDKPQTWVQVRSPHFLVISNAGEKQVRKVTGQFERMQSVFHVLFPTVQQGDPGMPIVVLAVKDEKDFRALEPQEYLAKGMLHLAGLFLRTPEKNYILLRLDAEGEHPYSIIYHEYTHLLTSKAEEWMPVWFNEGLAEFFQNTDIHDNEASLGEPDSQNLMLLQQNTLLPLSTIFTVDHSSPYYHEENKGSIFYAESWALTHYLEVKDFDSKTHHLSDYAALLSQKVDPITAATRAFGDLLQLQKTLQGYVSQRSYKYFKVQAPTVVDDSAFQLQALPEVQANAVRADFLAYDQRPADAHALLDQVLHDDPQNAAARETLGFLAFREGHLDEARKWYAEAVKLDSQSYLAHYYYALMTLRSGLGEGDDEATRVENSLRTAIKLNPKFAPPYDALAIFYMRQRRNLDEAHMLAVTAISLDPANFNFRLNTANLLMTMEQPENAVRVVQAALNLAKSPAERDRAEMMLDQIRSYEAVRKKIQEAGQHNAQLLPGGMVSESEPDDAVPALRREEPAPQGAHHSLTGLIRNVQCSPPSTLDFSFASGSQTMDLHSGNYFRIQYSALNFTPEGELKPCSDLEGKQAKVEFIDPADKTAKRWIIAVEIRK
jgi:tetratricopeptide (TPR) repeat protein